MALSSHKPTYRIVHLSDLHLTARDSERRSEPRLFGPLRGMNAALRRILRTSLIAESDLVLVTGDITDRGDLESWSIFRETVVQAGVDDRLIVVPGNHDVCCLGLARFPKPGGRAGRDLKQATEGIRLACQSSRMIPAGKARFDRFPWIVRPVPELAVFGLNSNNLGNLTVATNARGDVDYYQLEGLARLFWKYREVPVKIVALHHSPNIPGAAAARRRELRAFSRLETAGHQIPRQQRQALRLLCLSHRVRLVVHGHLHRAEDRYVAAVRTIGAPATTEPYGAEGGAACYRFFSYTLRRSSAKVRVKLEAVPA